MSDSDQTDGAAPSADAAYGQAADSESDEVARFVAVTNCPPEQAQFFLQAAGGFEQAVTLFFGEPLCGCQPVCSLISAGVQTPHTALPRYFDFARAHVPPVHRLHQHPPHTSCPSIPC